MARVGRHPSVSRAELGSTPLGPPPSEPPARYSPDLFSTAQIRSHAILHVAGSLDDLQDDLQADLQGALQGDLQGDLQDAVSAS
ncbi:hypothetical protein EYF80_016785 [Liparis tanakae]|uniref:Uncharacterized protein n=1 Tax=Liparis tanakae TaxID=230148 RepID=A0A4Z2I6A9_9TELE|nr:hypothetical protein EYF80_016785 [Liparis tanakae]